MEIETPCPRPKSVVIREQSLRSVLLGVCFATCALQSAIAGSQETEKKVAAAPPFFDAQDPIEVTLTANIGKLRSDKGAEHPWRPATMSYKGQDGNSLTVPLQARTRGLSRLHMCDFPPLRLNFSDEKSKGSIFHQLDKPKLVSYCRDNDSYEQYILQEFQLYRIYQLLTPVSHRARLLRLTYADSASGQVRTRRYGFVIEEPKAIAARVGGTVIEQTGAGSSDLDPDQNALLGVFQYMIGNTDFSIAGLHNVELLLREDGSLMPIAYDFDFAGAVNAKYATPDPKVNLPDVRHRRFRGYCTDPASYARVFAVFVEKKPQIYALYSDEIGKLMNPGTVKETLQYFDEFYETINNPRSARRSIIEPCLVRP
jgi:hypothetical protein